MSLVSSSIANLVNGVSQQPYTLRLASQAEEQVNAQSSVVEGLGKRPPSRHVAKVLDTPLSNAYLHTINRDPTERYTVVIEDGNLRVFTLAGVEKTVNFPNGKGYLDCGDAKTDFTAMSVADYTFILNKTKVAQASPEVIPVGRPSALVWVRQGAYGTAYTVTIAGVTTTYTTNSAGAYPGVDQSIQTGFIATTLAGLISSHIPAGYDIGTFGSTIFIVGVVGQPMLISTADGLSDRGLQLVSGKVQRFTDLPARGVGGFRVRVVSKNDSDFEGYWVEYEVDANTPTQGTWKESTKPGEIYKLDPATLPHNLVREADGSFTFRPAAWGGRKVGELATVPMPSFVGSKLADVFFHRNRLGFLAGENIVLSRAGEFFEFFQESAIQSVDTDVIDVAVSHVKVSNLRHAVPFNEALLLFSEQTQFSLRATDLLTPKTVSIVQTTEFECALQAKPVGAGKNVYFAVNRDTFAGIREYYTDERTLTKDATDVTSHCPRYIPRGIVKMVAATNEDALVVLSEADRRSLYVYRYYWDSPQEKLQSAWSRWEFGPDDVILNCDFIESVLWVVVSRPSGTFIESLSFAPVSTESGSLMRVHLDRLVTQASVLPFYSSVAGTTSFTLPYTPEVAGAYQCISGNGVILPFRLTGAVVTVPGNVSAFSFGRRYVMRYRFSPLVIRENTAGGSPSAVTSGRVQVRQMLLNYANTGYFRVEVTPLGGQTFSYVFSGRILGSAQNVVGSAAIETGSFKFPVVAKNDQVTVDLVNDSFLPCSFTSAEWEAMFTTRARRV